MACRAQAGTSTGLAQQVTVSSRDVPTEGDDDAQNAEYRCVRGDHESDDNDAEQWLEAVVRG